MKVMMIPVVIGALGTVTKRLVQGLEDLEIRGRVETIQMTALLRLARILRRVLETWGDSDFSGKPSANAGVKNIKMSKMIIIKSVILLNKKTNKKNKKRSFTFKTQNTESGRLGKTKYKSNSKFNFATRNDISHFVLLSYLPTPPLGQDMTQSQFLSGVLQVWIQNILSPRLVASPKLKNPVCPTIYP